ncbi:hypothetical protein ACFSJU_12300 [Paradesertivirga mongoliensis]|uniref:Uncharacterized protein n=1 Tax=Paradesertivirga mongoliensis TaxID=2100740 RepID=A0ABW4ZM79_9SPHI|nr:hypothetical protein [Pedobacter mongoliensis]
MKSVRKVENIHIFLWLLKDSCWVMDFQKLGVFMIMPTVLVAFFITYRTRSIKTELFHNIAVCCWVLANSVWMIGEFFYDDTTRPYATAFFVTGVLVMTYYYLFLHFKPVAETADVGVADANMTKSAALEPVE